MDEELKRILDENLAISKESLKILKGIRRGNRLAIAFKFFYWLVIIGSAVGAYYFLEPYVKSAVDIIQGVQGTLSSTQKTSGTNGLSPDLLKQLQNFLKTK